MSTPERWELDADAARVALGEWIARERPSDGLQRVVSVWLVDRLGPDPLRRGQYDELDLAHGLVPGTEIGVIWVLDRPGLLVKPVMISTRPGLL